MAFLAGQKVTAAALNIATEKTVARARRTSASTTTTTIVGVKRMDDHPVVAGYSYRIKANVHPTSSVTTDNIRVDIRYTTDGSTPTTASSVMPGGQLYTTPAHHAIDFPYVPAADETLSLLLCVARDTGSGNVSMYADASRITDMDIENAGIDPGATGTDI